MEKEEKVEDIPKKKKKYIKHIIWFIILGTIIGLILYFNLRPDIKSITFSDIEYKVDTTYVYVNVVVNDKYAKIQASDFMIYANGLPLKADSFSKKFTSVVIGSAGSGNVSESEILEQTHQFDNKSEATLRILFNASQYSIYKPFHLYYQNQIII